MTPQATLGCFVDEDAPDLTAGEREVYEAIETKGYGPREYARRTSRSPGTVGNLLARTREKMEGDDGE